MKQHNRKMMRLATACATLVLLLMAVFTGGWYARSAWKLPYTPDFHHELHGWKTYGGSWSLKDGMVVNQSDERGAKIITGSANWSNYQVTSDVRLIGHAGDGGLVLRVSRPEIGIDAYQGYYIGLSLKGLIFAGETNYEWLERAPVVMPGGFRTGGWYRIHAVIAGCTVAAAITNLETNQQAWTGFREMHCLLSGKTGLRSLGTGASWRNFSVANATVADANVLLDHVQDQAAPAYPGREDELAKMEARVAREKAAQHSVVFAAPVNRDQAAQALPTQPIRSLENTRIAMTPVYIRGSVTSVSPLYLQDTSGGIAVQMSSPAWLNIGDEVEVHGIPVSIGPKVIFRGDSMRLLWERSFLLPAPVSSTQAASGAFEGSLVEVSGEVESTDTSNSGSINLILSDIAQRFRVVIPRGLDQLPSIQPGTRLRVIGVCSGSSGADAAEIPFVLYTRGYADVQVLSSPPWTRGRRLGYLICGAFAVLLLLIWLYVQAERWRLSAVLHERERLAIDMHDTLAQSFAGVGFHLQSMRRGFEQQGDVSPRMMNKLDEACEMASHSHREASARILALHPNALIQGDLLTLIQRSAMSMLNGAQLPIKLQRKGQRREISPRLQDSLLRIAREAVANVLRHSFASEMVLTLEYGAKTVALIIADNGVGMKDSDGRSGMESMRLRASEVGASVSVMSMPGQGTSVTVRAPYGKRFSLSDWIRFQYDRTVFRRKAG